MDLVTLDDLFGDLSLSEALSCNMVISCGILTCVLKTLVQKSWRSRFSSPIDLHYSAHALEMIKRERKKQTEPQQKKETSSIKLLSGQQTSGYFLSLNP